MAFAGRLFHPVQVPNDNGRVWTVAVVVCVFCYCSQVGGVAMKEIKSPHGVNALVVVLRYNPALNPLGCLLNAFNPLLCRFPDNAIRVFRRHSVNAVVMVPQQQNIGLQLFKYLMPL